MKIGLLGVGCWGFCLASLLASKEIQVVCWTTNPELAKQLTQTREHPKLLGHHCPDTIVFTTDLEEALEDIDLLVEAVTCAGLRPVFEKIQQEGIPRKPIVITSKGIEQNSGLILPDVAAEILGEECRPLLGCVSGPSYAQEVIQKLPTSVVGAAYDHDVMMLICETFMTPSFRVYPNSDVLGVALGGALKNVVAIACGIADGMGLGFSARAALMTRGLHEIRKLAIAKGGKAETLSGLAGLGDLCVTCNSSISRNFSFGSLLAKGISPKEALKKVGMVVEGAYTCVSALQLSKKFGVPMPITEAVYQIVYENMKLQDAVEALMMRSIKEEHL